MQRAETAENKTDTQSKSSRKVTPIEPLFSMLTEAPVAALQAMLADLNGYNDESELDQAYQSIGVTRRVMLEQVKLAISSRGAEQLTIF